MCFLSVIDRTINVPQSLRNPSLKNPPAVLRVVSIVGKPRAHLPNGVNGRTLCDFRSAFWTSRSSPSAASTAATDGSGSGTGAGVSSPGPRPVATRTASLFVCALECVGSDICCVCLFSQLIRLRGLVLLRSWYTPGALVGPKYRNATSRSMVGRLVCAQSTTQGLFPACLYQCLQRRRAGFQ